MSQATFCVDRAHRQRLGDHQPAEGVRQVRHVIVEGRPQGRLRRVVARGPKHVRFAQAGRPQRERAEGGPDRGGGQRDPGGAGRVEDGNVAARPVISGSGVLADCGVVVGSDDRGARGREARRATHQVLQAAHARGPHAAERQRPAGPAVTAEQLGVSARERGEDLPPELGRPGLVDGPRDAGELEPGDKVQRRHA